jgi:hypothetical protein
VLTRTVLMTGAASSIAVQLLPVFQEQYDPTLVDVKTTNAHGQTGPEVRIANLSETDAEQYRSLLQGITRWCTSTTTVRLRRAWATGGNEAKNMATNGETRGATGYRGIGWRRGG